MSSYSVNGYNLRFKEYELIKGKRVSLTPLALCRNACLSAIKDYQKNQNASSAHIDACENFVLTKGSTSIFDDLVAQGVLINQPGFSHPVINLNYEHTV